MAHAIEHGAGGHGAGRLPAFALDRAAHAIERAARCLGHCSGFRLWVWATGSLLLVWLPALMGVPL